MSKAARYSCKYILEGTGPMVDHRVEVKGDGHLLRRYADPARPDPEENLSPLRWRLLDLLVGEKQRPFSSDELAAALQQTFPDLGHVAPNAIANHISHLRSALGDEAKDSGFIQTQKGAYQLCALVKIHDFAWPPVDTSEVRKPVQKTGTAAGASPLRENPREDSPRSETLAEGGEKLGPRAANGHRFWARYGRLVALGSAFAVIVPILLLVVRQPFKVGTGAIDDNSDPLLKESLAKLPGRLKEAIDSVPEWGLYGFSNFPLDRPARLAGTLSRGGGRLLFDGTLRGLGSGCQPRLRQEAPETFSKDLVDKLAEDVALQLDWEACFHELRLSPWDSKEENIKARAQHCLRAAWTLRDDLRYCKAKEALVMARELDPSLLEAGDLLASVYENQGLDEEALKLLKRQIEEAGAEMPPSLKARFQRRIAQLEGNIRQAITQLERLADEEKEKNDALAAGEEPSWRQSMALSWFYRIHRQNCERALEALPRGHGNPALEADFTLACGDSEKAIELYQERYFGEGDLGALYPLTHGWRLGGFAKEARVELEKQLERAPKFHRARLGLVHLLTEQGCAAAAATQSSILLRQIAESSRADLPKALLSSPAPAPPPAVQRCLDESSLDPEDDCRPRVLERNAHIAAALLIEVGAISYEEALSHARAAQYAREDFPKKPYRWSMRAAWAEGLVHLAADRPERVPVVEAVLERIKAARDEGHSLWEGHLLHHLRARRLFAAGQPESAAVELRIVLDDYDVEQHALFRTELAEALLAAGDVEAARQELEHALDFDPNFRRAECQVRGLEGGNEALSLCLAEENPVCAPRGEIAASL